MSIISIQLIKLATADIEYKGFENADFLLFIPVGFFCCEYTIAVEEGSAEELISFEENIIVYEFNKDNYTKLIKFISTLDLTPYAAENIAEGQIKEKAEELADEFFNIETDNFDGLLIGNIIKIIRHISQNNTSPIFVDFHERDFYDMDKLADDLLNIPPLDADIILTNKFNDMGLHWNFFYKGYDNFMDAYYKSQKRVLTKRRGQPVSPEIKPNDEQRNELTDEIKRQVFARDNFTCICCGKEQRKGVPLNADHIRPVSMGGNNAVSNLQTLCRHCNTVKGVNEVDYRVNITPLRKAKSELQMFERVNSDYVQHSVARIVNVFYHCKAMCTLNYHQRKSGQFYSTWEIVLFAGNNPEWLKSYESELLEYVHTQLGWNHVVKITIKN